MEKFINLNDKSLNTSRSLSITRDKKIMPDKKFYGILFAFVSVFILCLIIIPIIVSLFSKSSVVIVITPFLVYGILVVSYTLIRVKIKAKRSNYYGYIIVLLLLSIFGIIVLFLFCIGNFANGIGYMQGSALATGGVLIIMSILGLIDMYKLNKKVPPTGSRYITANMRRKYWRIYGDWNVLRCEVCKSLEGLEYVHIIPLDKGGTNVLSNIKVLCQRCIKEDFLSS